MPVLPEDVEAPTFRIAIGVSKSDKKLSILKWALENVVPVNGKLYLIHVQSPLRRVPNALGGKFPIEKVDPDTVERYKIHRFLETQKLLDKYRRLCDKKKIQTVVCYSESESVQKELVSQALRFGIAKLILGISSQTLISRALRKDGISKYVAKYSPAFCTVIFVNKGKVYFSKFATEAPTMQNMAAIFENDSVTFRLSETTAGGANACEEDSRTLADMHNGERILCPVLQNGLDLSHDNYQCKLQKTLLTEACVSGKTLEDNSGMIHKVGSIHTTSDGKQTIHHNISGTSDTGILIEEFVPQPVALIHKDSSERPSLPASNCTVMEHEAHWVETFRKENIAMCQAENDAIRYKDALAVLNLDWRDCEKINKRLAEEVARHKDTQMELLRQKQMVKACLEELAWVQSHAETEERLSNMKLEDMAGKLETESQLRRTAEMASQEVLAKLAALENKLQGCYEYSFQELQSATNNFDEENMLGQSGCCPVYKGKLHHMTVSIKVIAQDLPNGHQEFHKEVELLTSIRHPHILMLLGACSERGCIVYEYMANGSLEDRLNCRDGTPPLPWHTRFRVCLEVATALVFLHSHPKFICHCGLKAANILFDKHFVSKLGGIGQVRALLPFTEHTIRAEPSISSDPAYQFTGIESCDCDVYALGGIMLQILTGRPAGDVSHVVKEVERSGSIANFLDDSAGDWPLEEAMKLAKISMQCTTVSKDRPRLETDILPVLASIQSVSAKALLSTHPIIPYAFLCPIYKEIMTDPYIAADGFTYEYLAIKVWLQANNTSPMTNVRLDHKNITPNYTMRSAIKDWHSRGLI